MCETSKKGIKSIIEFKNISFNFKVKVCLDFPVSYFTIALKDGPTGKSEGGIHRISLHYSLQQYINLQLS